MSVPVTRTLPYVLRERLSRSAGLRLQIYEVAAIPDTLTVTVTQQGVQTTIPRLSTYTPTVGEPCYVLAADTVLFAIGAVGGTAGTAGPQGPPGPTGPTGPAGAQGAKGDTGTAGPTGPAGAAGAQGIQGPQGPQGPAGATGAQGAKGDTGAQGPQGIQGPAGPSGASTFVSGTGAPTAGTGVDGAIYLDTASGRLYGPKAAGAWPATPLGRIVPLTPTYAQLKTG